MSRLCNKFDTLDADGFFRFVFFRDFKYAKWIQKTPAYKGF